MPVLTRGKVLSMERQRLHSDNSPPPLCLCRHAADPSLQLHPPREGTIDHEIGPRDKTRRRASQKDGGVGHFLGCPHASRRIQGQSLLEELRVAVLDLLPHAAGEIRVAGRDRKALILCQPIDRPGLGYSESRRL